MDRSSQAEHTPLYFPRLFEIATAVADVVFERGLTKVSRREPAHQAGFCLHKDVAELREQLSANAGPCAESSNPTPFCLLHAVNWRLLGREGTVPTIRIPPGNPPGDGGTLQMQSQRGLAVLPVRLLRRKES